MSDKYDITGVYHATANAYGFFTPDTGGEDYFVPPRHSGGAWDGDRVSVKQLPKDGGERTAVTVTRVLERSKQTVTGVLRKENGIFRLDPTDPKVPSPILITGRLHNARNGDRAAVQIRNYAYGWGQTPSGILTQIFGPSGAFPGIIEAILYEHDIHPEFPPAAMIQAMRIPEELTPGDRAGRLDLREQTIITIDGASSRDFDDAISLEKNEKDHWVLGVHIADVSHYVPLRSPLDEESFARGTSVYYADRVAPMLPIALSNGICSLNPHVDRLALSCFMTMDNQGNILSYDFAKSIIHSTERMTYEDCNRLLEGKDVALDEKYSHILPMLQNMAHLATILTKKRRLRGSLTLESTELVVQCDENGEPVGLGIRESGRSESLIEEFMLAANETVAKYLSEMNIPAVYRVHEKPSLDKLETLRTVLAPLGYQLGTGDSFSLQKIVDAVNGKPEAPMVNTLLLRSQKKARYDQENLGHFALAAPHYCHFTSPIRRYPDLMVHRALTALLDEGKHGKTLQKLNKVVADSARQSSLREIAATEAEREIEKRYAAKFLSQHLGVSFAGAVSGITRLGLFILLTCGAEGLLPIESLPSQNYHYDENTLTLTDVDGNTIYTIGTPITVIIASADVESGQVELALEGVTRRSSSQHMPKAKSSHRSVRHGKPSQQAFRPPRKKSSPRGKRR